MYVWWKEKKIVFLYKEKKKDFSLRIYVQKDWLRDHSSQAPCGIEMKIKGILKSWLWISLHQGTLSILCSRIQCYTLSLMNEVDPCLLLPLCVLYEMQNQIFQQEQLDILDQIAISGQPLNKATVWSHRETKISFHPLLLLLEIYSKPSCSFRTWMASILPPHHQIKDSSNRKVLPRCGRKKALSNLVNFSLSPFLVFEYALLVCFAFLFWVNLVLCFALFNMFLFVCFQFCFILLFIKKKSKIKKIQKQYVFCVHWYLCTLDGHWNKIL